MAQGFNRTIRNYLITGGLILTPIAVTIYIIVSGFLFLDRFLGRVVAYIFGRPIPGVGFILTILAVILVGMVATNVIGRRLINLGEQFLTRIPIVSVVYSGIKQLLEAFTVQNRGGFKKVVFLEFPRRGVWSIGFVTNEDDWTDNERIGKDSVTVFVPTGPNPTTGFVMVVPQEELVFSDLPVEAAFKVVISGGIVEPTTNGSANGSTNGLRD